MLSHERQAVHLVDKECRKIQEILSRVARREAFFLWQEFRIDEIEIDNALVVCHVELVTVGNADVGIVPFHSTDHGLEHIRSEKVVVVAEQEIAPLSILYSRVASRGNAAICLVDDFDA